jgi:hypothetical protein
MPADVSRIALRPRAFHQGVTRMGVASVGERTLSASRARGVFRGRQTRAFQQFSRGIEAGEVAEFGHHSDGHGALHAASGLERVDHRVQAPRLDLFLACLFATLEAFGVVGHGAAVFV